MGKKKASGKHYTSKGLIGVDKKILNKVRTSRTEAENMLNKFRAFLRGGNPWITIDNPDTNATNKRRIRVRLKDRHGDVKKYKYGTNSA